MNVNLNVSLTKDTLGYYQLKIGGLTIDEFCFEYQDVKWKNRTEVKQTVSRFDDSTELMLIENSIMDGFGNENDLDEVVEWYKELINKLGVEKE